MKTIDEYVIKVSQLFEKVTVNNESENTKIDLPEYGSVDAKIVSNGNKKYYYSEDLKINVKFESADVTVTIEKFDTSVIGFNINVP